MNRYLIIARRGSHVLERVALTGLRLVPKTMVDLGWKYPCVQIEFIDVKPVDLDAWLGELAEGGGV